MATYAIGDVQGCFAPLQDLLTKVFFDSARDRLLFLGDLVNRGPESLRVLRFVKSLNESAMTVLGNHDLHLLAIAAAGVVPKEQDTLNEVLAAPDCAELCDWLRTQPILHYEQELDYVIVHAGFPPQWDLSQAKQYAKEVSDVLTSSNANIFLQNMYGQMPNQWDENLKGFDRLRYIVNAFTRIRFCDEQGRLEFSEKGDLVNMPVGYRPWFEFENRKSRAEKIVFGHWAALYNQWDTVINIPNIFPLDSGCVWGNCLSALRLEDGKRFSVACS